VGSGESIGVGHAIGVLATCCVIPFRRLDKLAVLAFQPSNIGSLGSSAKVAVIEKGH